MSFNSPHGIPSSQVTGEPLGRQAMSFCFLPSMLLHVKGPHPKSVTHCFGLHWLIESLGGNLSAILPGRSIEQFTLLLHIHE